MQHGVERFSGRNDSGRVAVHEDLPDPGPQVVVGGHHAAVGARVHDGEQVPGAEPRGQLHPRGEGVRRLAHGPRHLPLPQLRPLAWLGGRHHGVPGPVQRGAEQLGHGAVHHSHASLGTFVYIFCVDVLPHLGAQDGAQQRAGGGHNGPARLHHDLVVRIPCIEDTTTLLLSYAS